jgi:hypothetical protein
MRILASLQGISDLIRAVAWPAVALAAVVWLRAPMGALLQRVASSARKLTIGSFSVELSESGPSSAPELASN